MSDKLHSQIINHLKTPGYRPQRERSLADALDVPDTDEHYHAFRTALKELTHAGRVVLGIGGAVTLPPAQAADGNILGTYRHNKRGFGFLVPSDPSGHEDLFIPEGHNGGAMTGDVVRGKVTSRGDRNGKAMFTGRITEVITRSQKRFVGTLATVGGDWVVLPDGNTLTEPILDPRRRRPARPARDQGRGRADDLPRRQPRRPGPRPGRRRRDRGAGPGRREGRRPQERHRPVQPAQRLPPEPSRTRPGTPWTRSTRRRNAARRLDLTDQLVCTIDPDDAKDYDDAISLRHLADGTWELGVHIADVSYFVPSRQRRWTWRPASRGNSSYFPGHVIPMLPEVLSNGVCSLQEGVARLCKSAFIRYDEDARPLGTKFANTVIHTPSGSATARPRRSSNDEPKIPHPEGDRTVKDYDPRPWSSYCGTWTAWPSGSRSGGSRPGRSTSTCPRPSWCWTPTARSIDAVPEDQSFTHTLIEMFMVEANEAVARLLNNLDVPFLRRTHPTPGPENHEKLRAFAQVSGYKLPKELDRHAIQALLAGVKGKPEAFSVNIAVLRSLTRAEYSPQLIGHYALASEQYCHFTSPIRRYADLMVHRLLDAYFVARAKPEHQRRQGPGEEDRPQERRPQLRRPRRAGQKAQLHRASQRRRRAGAPAGESAGTAQPARRRSSSPASSPASPTSASSSSSRRT